MQQIGQDAFLGVFVHTADGRLGRHPQQPSTLPDPTTGRALQIATVELSGAICPSCDEHGEGGFVSFVTDLRMVFACPKCCTLSWLAGA